MFEHKIPPVTTIKCPVCHKGDIPLPLDESGCQYCRHCGASYDTVYQYIKVYWILLKWALYGIISFLICYLLF